MLRNFLFFLEVKMKTRGKIIATLALSVLVAGTIYGVKSHAGYSIKADDLVAHAKGLEEDTLEAKEWAEDNVVKINDAEDYYDFVENGATDANQYLDEDVDADYEPVSEGQESDYEFPSSIDNSTSKYFPAIGDQGDIGSCVSWAMLYYQFSYTYNQLYDRSSKDVNNLFSPMFSYDNCGGYPLIVTEFLEEMGAAYLSEVPALTDYNNIDDYPNNTHAEGDIWKKAATRRITDAYVISTNDSNMKISNYYLLAPKRSNFSIDGWAVYS